MTMALTNSTRSEPNSRSASQAPRMVDRYTEPPYAPTIPPATASGRPRPPSATEKYR